MHERLIVEQVLQVAAVHVLLSMASHMISVVGGETTWHCCCCCCSGVMLLLLLLTTMHLAAALAHGGGRVGHEELPRHRLLRIFAGREVVVLGSFHVLFDVVVAVVVV